MTNITKEEVEQVVNKQMARGKFKGKAKIDEHYKRPSFRAGICKDNTEENRLIEISYNPRFEEDNPTRLVPTIEDITRHEINHYAFEGHKGCPRTLDLHANGFIEPMAKFLLPRRFSNNDVHYVANALQDTILHQDLSSEFTLDGIVNFFVDIGECGDESKFTLFYEAHVKLNMYLWGSKQQKAKLQRFFAQNHKDNKVRKVLKDFLKQSGIGGVNEYQKCRSKAAMREYLNDESNWPKISEAYARTFYELMVPSYAMPISNHSGEGTLEYKEREYNEPEQEPQPPSPEIDKPNNDYHQDEEFNPQQDEFEDTEEFSAEDFDEDEDSDSDNESNNQSISQNGRRNDEETENDDSDGKEQESASSESEEDAEGKGKEQESGNSESEAKSKKSGKPNDADGKAGKGEKNKSGDKANGNSTGKPKEGESSSTTKSNNPGNEAGLPTKYQRLEIPTHLRQGSEFDRKMYDRKYQRERLVEAYLSDKNMPSLISIHENLDLLYEFLAQKLNIKIESYTSQMGMPIFFYGKADYDPEIHKPKHLIFDFNEKGELVIRRKRYSESIIVPVKSNPKGPPEISFLLLDTSESMEHSPNCNGYCDGRCKGKTSIIPWGDKSKYHYSVLTVYSFLKYLGVNHLDEHINKIKLGNFSNTTYLSEGLDEIKKSMFSPQFGGTRLNLDKIKKIMSGEGMLIFTISDGEISNLNNWVSPPEYKDRVLVKPGVTLEDEFIRMAKNHYYFHLQIGSKNNFTAKLEKHGLSVSYIKGDEDLAKNVIDLTDGVYRGLLR